MDRSNIPIGRTLPLTVKWPDSNSCYCRAADAFRSASFEVFDLGHARFAAQMVAEGLISAPPLCQECLGVLRRFTAICLGGHPNESCSERGSSDHRWIGAVRIHAGGRYISQARTDDRV